MQFLIFREQQPNRRLGFSDLKTPLGVDMTANAVSETVRAAAERRFANLLWMRGVGNGSDQQVYELLPSEGFGNYDEYVRWRETAPAKWVQARREVGLGGAEADFTLGNPLVYGQWTAVGEPLTEGLFRGAAGFTDWWVDYVEAKKSLPSWAAMREALGTMRITKEGEVRRESAEEAKSKRMAEVTLARAKKKGKGRADGAAEPEEKGNDPYTWAAPQVRGGVTSLVLTSAFFFPPLGFLC